jgi:single-stranded DNA-binding protein
MQMLSAKQDGNDAGGGNKTYAKTEKSQEKPQVENPPLPDDNDDLPF